VQFIKRNSGSESNSHLLAELIPQIKTIPLGIFKVNLMVRHGAPDFLQDERYNTFFAIGLGKSIYNLSRTGISN